MEVMHTDALKWTPAMGMGSAQARVVGLAFKFSQILAKFYPIMKF
jgi:hypothetical protein